MGASSSTTKYFDDFNGYLIHSQTGVEQNFTEEQDRILDTATQMILKNEPIYDLLLPLAKAGNPVACHNIGYYLLQQQDKEGLRWLEQAASVFHQSQVIIALHYLDDNQFEKSFQSFISSAERGNVKAQMELGVMFQKGLGCVQNEQKGFEWTLKAAQNGSVEAMNNAGMYYYYGTGVEKDVKKSIFWYEKAADKGFGLACYTLGRIYGEEPDHLDHALSFLYYMKSYDYGQVTAVSFIIHILTESLKGSEKYLLGFEKWICDKVGTTSQDSAVVSDETVKRLQEMQMSENEKLFCLSLYYLLPNSKDLGKAIELFHQAGEEGHCLVQAVLADWYYTSDPVDIQKGFEWIRKSAESGLAPAQLKYGVELMRGTVEKDLSLGVGYIQKAVEQGLPTAMDELARCYLLGRGVEKNQEKAIDLLHNAIVLGNGRSCFALGSLYEDGILGDVDLEAAFEYYIEGEKYGDAECMARLGRMYILGLYVKQDRDCGFRFFEKAEKMGSQYVYPYLYEVYTDKEKDETKAMEVLERGMKKDIPFCHVQYAELLFEGVLCQKDIPKATAILEKVAIKNAQAYYLLGLHCSDAGNTEKAFEAFMNGAKQNHLSCMYQVGMFYDKGIHVNEDKEQAKQWYLLAANESHETAIDALGNLYLEAKDYDNALHWFRKLAELGSAIGENNVGLCYLKGYAVETDIQQGYEWTLKAAEKGLAISQNTLGNLFLYGLLGESDLDKAREWYEKSAAQGHSDAMVALGNMYDFGNGVESNPDKAMEYFLKASELDNPDACNNIGSMYLNGKGIDVDNEKAFMWYQRGAKLNSVHCFWNLGTMYESGKFVEQDYTKALEYYVRAAEMGFREAMFTAGLAFLYGKGCEENNGHAFKFMLDAAENGHILAEYNMGIFYEGGVGVEPDLVFAFEWFLKAADHGYSDAQYKVAMALLNGTGCEADEAKAFTYFLKASDEVPAAMYIVGVCYISGDQAEVDVPKGIEFIKKAALLDYGIALEAMGDLYCEEKYGIEKDLKEALSWYEKAFAQGSLENLAKLRNIKIQFYLQEAEQGNAEAITKVSAIYIKQSMDSFTMDWFSRLRAVADQGDPEAQYLVGRCYEQAILVEDDLEKAQELYRLSAEQGNQSAIKCLYNFENRFSNEDCLICMQPLKAHHADALSCGHSQFHTDCIQLWIESNHHQCPYCRHAV